MVFAQQIFVLFNYWWKHMGLGLAKNVRGLEIGVGLAYAEAALTKTLALTMPGSRLIKSRS